MRNRLGEDQWYLWRHFAKIARGFFLFCVIFSLFKVCNLPVISNGECNAIFGNIGDGVFCVDTAGGRGSCNVRTHRMSIFWRFCIFKMICNGKEASTCFEHFYTRATPGVRPSWEFPEKIRATSGKRWKSNNCCHNQWDFRNQYDFQTTRSGLYPLDLPLAANLEYQQPSQGFLFYKTDDMYQTHHDSLWACFHLYICPTYLPFPPTLLHYLINAREIS